MSGFDASWLALREPADRDARSRALAQELRDWLVARNGAAGARIVDLGCGAGANPRFLAPLLEMPQHWLCIDDDTRLLSALAADPALGFVRTSRLDLARELSALRQEPFHVLTASALLDLVSQAWLDDLLAIAASARAAVLFALSFDGRIEVQPAHSADAAVITRFGAHQGRDKGFGPALGPRAPAQAAAALQALGYRVRRQKSDWRIGADGAELARELVSGLAAAAAEQDSTFREAGEWLEQRIAQAEAGTLRIVVGHEDLLGLPPQ